MASKARTLSPFLMSGDRLEGRPYMASTLALVVSGSLCIFGILGKTTANPGFNAQSTEKIVSKYGASCTAMHRPLMSVHEIGQIYKFLLVFV